MQPIQDGFKQVQQNVNSYIQTLPDDLGLKAAQGAFASTAIAIMFGHVTLVPGALAATATLIEAIIRPLIKKFFPQGSTGEKASIIFSATATIALAHAVVSSAVITPVAIACLLSMLLNPISGNQYTARLFIF